MQGIDDLLLLQKSLCIIIVGNFGTISTLACTELTHRDTFLVTAEVILSYGELTLVGEKLKLILINVSLFPPIGGGGRQEGRVYYPSYMYV